MAFGTYKAPFPRGRVLRGWDPQNPTKQTKGLPVTKVTREDGTTGPEWIYPGHIISATPSGSTVAWTKGVPTGTDVTDCILACAAEASTDLNTAAAKSLMGMELTDSFRFATPFFRRNTGDTYTVGTRLTYCAATEAVTTGGTAGSAIGYIRPAATGETVIGIVVESGSGINGSVDLQKSFLEAVDSSSVRENAYYVIWDTAYQPAAPSA